MNKDKEKLKKKLIDQLGEQIRIDAINGDITVLDELLYYVPVFNLLQATNEGMWKKYKDLLTEKEKKKLGL